MERKIERKREETSNLLQINEQLKMLVLIEFITAGGIKNIIFTPKQVK